MTELIDTVEASRILGLTRQWVGALIKRGELKAERIGRSWILTREEVDAYKKRMEEHGTTIDTGNNQISAVD